LNEDISILYIDDDELAIDYFRTVLEERYKKIITASSGIDGVNKFFETLPDIVIVDIIMPDINGIDVAVKIKEKYKDTEIIAVSSSDSSKNLMGAINAGIRNFILKPISADKIYKIIEELSENIKIKRELKEYRQKLEETVEIRTNRFQRISEKLITEIEERENIEKKYSIIMEILEQSPFGVVVTDEKFNIEYINKKAVSLAENEYKEYTGKKIETVFSYIDKNEIEENLKKENIFKNEKNIISKIKGNGNFLDLYQIIIR
jgi:YesN/AraC family two-component response regulator